MELAVGVAVKDRRNGSLNPYAHLRQPGITLETVRASPMLWDPVRYDETCPSSDGACAVILGDRAAAEATQASGRPVAWIRATAMRTEPTMFSGKDHVNPRAGAADQAGLLMFGDMLGERMASGVLAHLLSPVDELRADAMRHIDDSGTNSRGRPAERV